MLAGGNLTGGGNGIIYSLTPPAKKRGSWTFGVVYEYTGTGVSATTTLIATGDNASGNWTSVSPVCTITNNSAPATPTGTPYSVVNVNGSIRAFYVANSSGIYQYIGSIAAGN
ncbi:MAG: hypothetical protein ACLP4V_31830 [Methylocella sp.]